MSKERNREFFAQTFNDANTDGKDGLTVQELKQLLINCGHRNMEDEDVAAMFADVDTSGDKLISLDEFLTETVDKRPASEIEECELRREFRNIDTDGSGTVTADELKGVYAKMGLHFSDEEMEAAIARADPSGDGKVTFEEFLADWRKSHGV